MQKNEQKFIITDEKSLDNCVFPLTKWDRIFFYGDLGAGKTTFIRALLRRHFNDNSLIIRSPTYTYYQEYSRENIDTVHHFDLYRLDDIENFFLIGGQEIAESEDSIMLIEWPEILGENITPTKIVKITFDAEKNKREIIIETFL